MLNIDMNANLYVYNGNIKIEYLNIDVYFDETSWNTREMFVSIIQISLLLEYQSISVTIDK